MFGVPPPFPQPPTWWQPGMQQQQGGGKGKGGGGKGKGGGGGGKGGHGRGRGRGRSGDNGPLFKPSFLENPWHRFFPDEPRTFDFRGTGAGAPPAPEELPPPTSLLGGAGSSGGPAAPAFLSAPMVDINGDELDQLRSDATDLHETLLGVVDPTLASQVGAVVQEARDRVRRLIDTSGGGTVVHVADEQPPKRSRMMLPPPKAAPPADDDALPDANDVL